MNVPASEATLDKLFEAMEWKSTMLSLGKANLESLTDTRALEKRLPGGRNDSRKQAFLAEFKLLIEDIYGKAMDFTEIRPALIKVYQETWTEGEVKALIKFYRSPVGKKVIRDMPSMLEREIQIVKDRVGQYQPELKSGVQGLVEKYYPELVKKK